MRAYHFWLNNIAQAVLSNSLLTNLCTHNRSRLDLTIMVTLNECRK